ncbi:MAG: hypothetical protein KDD84_10690 [Caldilineaceae bacterium]|nr:hypothetical protein [Caldilineaceae bacterium]
MQRIPPQTEKTAIVIGASIGGLLTARALADHYDHVTLLERDCFPAPGEQRKGVPQGKHAHAVLVRGLQIMEAYFPGLTAYLVEQGADCGDVSEKARWFNDGVYHQPCLSGYNAICVSRPLLEAAVRERVLALSNVDAIEGCDVLGLFTTENRQRVTGVRVIRRRAGSAEETLRADLTVDASGRGSRTPAWLENLGYARPEEESVKIGMTYASCEYRRRPDHIPGVNALIVAATPPNRRNGVLLGEEGNRWIVTAAGYLGEILPTNHAEMVEFVKGLPTPEIYEVIKDAEPLGEVSTHKIPSNLRRRYERLARFPQGYLVIGDALCSFNPVYGQGMTVAALESLTLGNCLSQGESRLAERFFKEAAKIVDIPWSTAVGNDLRFPEIEGQRTPMTRFINWYVSKLHHAAGNDASVSIAFLQVINLLKPPPSLMHPRIMWRVWRGNPH